MTYTKFICDRNDTDSRGNVIFYVEGVPATGDDVIATVTLTPHNDISVICHKKGYATDGRVNTLVEKIAHTKMADIIIARREQAYKARPLSGSGRRVLKKVQQILRDNGYVSANLFSSLSAVLRDTDWDRTGDISPAAAESRSLRETARRYEDETGRLWGDTERRMAQICEFYEHTFSWDEDGSIHIADSLSPDTNTFCYRNAKEMVDEWEASCRQTNRDYRENGQKAPFPWCMDKTEADHG